MVDQPEGAPLGYLVMHPGEEERPFPIFDRLFIGRECTGIDPTRRLLIEDMAASRDHCEVRLDLEQDRAHVIDMSTNGTKLNGNPIERATPVRIRPGDRITVATTVFEFRSPRFMAADRAESRSTHVGIRVSTMVLVVGDIVSYSTVVQATEATVVAESLHQLWAELGVVLRDHRGTLNHYAGDALYAVWDPAAVSDAREMAIEFALTATDRLAAVAPRLGLRYPDGSPIRMGWSIVEGDAAVTSMTRSAAVIGDATNLAFRLSGIAGRDGRPPVIVTQAVHNAVESSYRWGPAEDVETKGRTGLETIYPVLGRM